MSNHGTHVRRAAQKPGCKPARKAIPLFVMAALLVLVLAGVGGTYAYLTYTTNQASNPLSTGDIQVQVLESSDGTSFTEYSDSAETDSYALGANSKQVKLKNPADEHNASEMVRVTFVPEVTSISNGVSTGANVFMDQTWSAPSTDADGNCLVTLGLVTLYFNPAWSDDWDYKDGTFYYKKALAQGEETPVLLMGVEKAAGFDTSKHGDVRVNVIADAIQESAAAQEWGISS